MQGQIFINELQGNFFLRTPKVNKPTPLYYVICYGSKKYRFSTGVKLYPDHWNLQRQEAYTSVRLSELDNINNNIVNQKVAEYTQNLFEFKAYLCNNPHEINNGEELLRKYIYKNKYIAMDIDCIQYLLNCIQCSDKGDGTKKDYNSAVKNLQQYFEKGNDIKSFDEITKKYVKGYYDYLRGIEDNPRTEDGKLTLDYINKQIGQLWNVLNQFAVENEKMNYKVLEEWKDRKAWRVTDKSKKNQKGIALRDDEILLLWDYWHKLVNQADKDILATFLLECLTGQRFSDTEKLTDNLETINSITTISLVQKKTGKKIQCGIIFKLAKDILTEYKNCMPTGYTNDYFNKRLKAIAKEAGIKGKETNTRHSGKNSSVSIKDKERWELTTSHTGRRTFITLLKLREWDDRRIQMYSGHETIDMIQQYAKIKSSVQYEVFRNGIKKNPDKILKYVDEEENQKLFGKSRETKDKAELSLNTTNNTHKSSSKSKIIKESIDQKIIMTEYPDGSVEVVTNDLQCTKVETTYPNGKIINKTDNHLYGCTIMETIHNDIVETVYKDDIKTERKVVNPKTGITEIEIINHIENTKERKIININTGITEEILIDFNTGLTEIVIIDNKQKTYISLETQTGRELNRRVENIDD